MQNIRLEITYDGTRYSGFQIQENGATIQGELERALAVLYKQKIRITGAGRTDAGVHARGQVANYYAPFQIPTQRLPEALKSLLPEEIVITGAADAAGDFHARFDAKGKIYTYTLDRAPYPQVMIRRFSHHFPDPLDLALMNEAARVLEGEHDFKAFQAKGSSVKDTVRNLRKVEIEDMPAEKLTRLTFYGDGFLYRMVRLLTGSLLRVGQGRLHKEDILLTLSGETSESAGPTASPRGLCLEKVIY